MEEVSCPRSGGERRRNIMVFADRENGLGTRGGIGVFLIGEDSEFEKAVVN